MALVVLLRGVNVGGHRTFRPSMLATQLRHLDVVNIGAAGTFVVRRPVSVAQVRKEFARRLPFETSIMTCQGRDIVTLLSRDFLPPPAPDEGIVRFVSVLSRTPRAPLSLPIIFPTHGPWLVQILAREKRLVVGQYRRHMRVIGYLGTLDKVFGVQATTRNWNTMTAIATVLQSGAL